MHKGVFITIEGCEGSGKTTLARLLEKDLTAKGYKVILTREPGGTPIANKIRSLLLDAEGGSMVPTAELLLFAAARAQHVEELVRPALENENTVVICDRFIDSTMAYQGNGRGLDKQLIQKLNVIATSGLEPDLTFLLLVDPKTGLNRVGERNETKTKFDLESIEFHKRVEDGFMECATKKRFRMINANIHPEHVRQEAMSYIEKYMKGAHKWLSK